MEEAPQERLRFGRQPRLVDGAIHEDHPAVTGALIQAKRVVADAKLGMAALLDVALRAAESVHQKIPQPLLRTRQIVRRIHRSEDLVARNLRIERAHQTLEAVLANLPVHFAFGHPTII